MAWVAGGGARAGGGVTPYEQAIVSSPLAGEGDTVVVTGRPTLSRPIHALLARPDVRVVVVDAHGPLARLLARSENAPLVAYGWSENLAINDDVEILASYATGRLAGQGAITRRPQGAAAAVNLTGTYPDLNLAFTLPSGGAGPAPTPARKTLLVIGGTNSLPTSKWPEEAGRILDMDVKNYSKEDAGFVYNEEPFRNQYEQAKRELPAGKVGAVIIADCHKDALMRQSIQTEFLDLARKIDDTWPGARIMCIPVLWTSFLQREEFAASMRERLEEIRYASRMRDVEVMEGSISWTIDYGVAEEIHARFVENTDRQVAQGVACYLKGLGSWDNRVMTSTQVVNPSASIYIDPFGTIRRSRDRIFFDMPISITGDITANDFVAFGLARGLLPVDDCYYVCQQQQIDSGPVNVLVSRGGLVVFKHPPHRGDKVHLRFSYPAW